MLRNRFPILLYIYYIFILCFFVGKRENFASFATFLNVYAGLGVIKSTCSQHFHHFHADLQRFLPSHECSVWVIHLSDIINRARKSI